MYEFLEFNLKKKVSCTSSALVYNNRKKEKEKEKARGMVEKWDSEEAHEQNSAPINANVDQ